MDFGVFVPRAFGLAFASLVVPESFLVWPGASADCPLPTPPALALLPLLVLLLPPPLLPPPPPLPLPPFLAKAGEAPSMSTGNGAAFTRTNARAAANAGTKRRIPRLMSDPSVISTGGDLQESRL